MKTENEPGHRGIRSPRGSLLVARRSLPAESRVTSHESPIFLSAFPALSAVKHGLLVSVVLCLLFLAGCANPKVKEPPAIKIEQLTQENTQLTEQVEKLTSQNKELKNQIQVLSGLPENVKLESIDRLESIRIGRYTGFFDKNNDGKKETLIVYIQPIDKQGDIIKEFGSVEVQLWDLNKPENKALLGQWKIGLDELKKLWFATVITSNYRLTFNVADIIDNLQEPLTVRVTFTDYPTGKVFTAQKVIEAP